MNSKAPSKRPASLQPLPLAVYLTGAVGSTFLICAPEAHSAIVYWNPADQTATPTGASYVFDMLTGNVTSSVSSSTYGFLFLNRTPSPDNYPSLFSTTSLPGGQLALLGVEPFNGAYNLQKISYGTSIGSDGNWGGNQTDFDFSSRPQYQWNTNLDGTTGYVGLRFNISSATHYGWARFTYDDATTGNLTLNDFAYENTAGASIAAGNIGAVPEPSRALLALAGLGAAALRRRRKQAA
jgi:hypothetical protein